MRLALAGEKRMWRWFRLSRWRPDEPTAGLTPREIEVLIFWPRALEQDDRPSARISVHTVSFTSVASGQARRGGPHRRRGAGDSTGRDQSLTIRSVSTGHLTSNASPASSRARWSPPERAANIPSSAGDRRARRPDLNVRRFDARRQRRGASSRLARAADPFLAIEVGRPGGRFTRSSTSAELYWRSALSGRWTRRGRVERRARRILQFDWQEKEQSAMDIRAAVAVEAASRSRS